MKIGTHNLGTNGHREQTFARVTSDGITIQQPGKHVTLSTEQIALLKDVLT